MTYFFLKPNLNYDRSSFYALYKVRNMDKQK